MDFNLPEELQMLKDTVRKFVDKELIPVEMHTIENMELKPDIRERLEKKTKEMGLWMFDVPEEYGGGGLGSLAQVLVWEELARTVALPSRGQGIFGPEIRPILYALNDEQKKRWLEPLKNWGRPCKSTLTILKKLLKRLKRPFLWDDQNSASATWPCSSRQTPRH